MERIAGLACTRSSAIKIYVSNSENGLDVYVEGAKPLDLVLQESIGSIAVEYQLARLSWDGELIASIKPPVQIMGNVKIIPPERFFMQATKDSEMAMVQDICESLQDETIVADLFCGCGTFTLPLAQTKKVMAFENSFQMLKALDNAYRGAPNLKIIETSRRNLQNNPLSSDELSGIGGVVVNPPRSGAADQCKELAKSKVKKVLIVSCNPETFSRDASILIMGGYNLDWVRIIDQFRWSHHIEVIGSFSKNF
jgi:23S rRNA (uracil1939-C5)-methyltransferase